MSNDCGVFVCVCVCVCVCLYALSDVVVSADGLDLQHVSQRCSPSVRKTLSKSHQIKKKHKNGPTSLVPARPSGGSGRRPASKEDENNGYEQRHGYENSQLYENRGSRRQRPKAFEMKIAESLTREMPTTPRAIKAEQKDTA